MMMAKRAWSLLAFPRALLILIGLVIHFGAHTLGTQLPKQAKGRGERGLTHPDDVGIKRVPGC